MARHAWIEGGRVRDYTDRPPADVFHPGVAALYDTVIPGDVERGWSLVDGTWTAPPPPPEPAPPPEPEPAPPWATKTPAEFVGLFTFAEEAAIAASDDPVVQVFYRRTYMPTLQQVERVKVIPGIGYLVSVELLTQARADAILAGEDPS
jgi:hypothetical protein